MTSQEFMAWCEDQPEGMRYELLDGVVYANGGQPEMQAERVAHVQAKGGVAAAFAAQIRARQMPCDAFVDGIAVHVDDDTTFEPDALVRCGPPLDADATLVPDPLIVVEVVSPSSQRIDALTKLGKYFHNPSIAHYLIVLPANRQVIHHRRAGGGRIETTIHHDGVIAFDPPGLTLDLVELFGEDRS
jgi:Uma2 family endonuclease